MLQPPLSIDVEKLMSIDVGVSLSVDAQCLYQGLQSPGHLSSDLLHYADDPPGHAGYLSPDLGPELSLVGPEKVSIDSNNGVSIDTPFSPSIDTTRELSIDVPSKER
ncbi:hypothetical protein F2Q69_00035939 [Brassica cretica]|uniref:Uncharacterized protein n=1 Tax=Brassica cretica TaxID=69181 RepID=A0A8S9SJB8_BRACR|nr:hypothetical protein F2Q69_00035939 [Brassica cretica]